MDVDKLQVLVDALKHGEALPNPPPWKIAGIAAMAAVGLINTVYPVPVTLDQIATLVGVAFAIYTQIATTQTLGLRKGGTRG